LKPNENFGDFPHPLEVGRAGGSDVVQSDDGRYRLGINDESSGFETRLFAEQVLALERPPPLIPECRGATAANGGPLNLIADFSQNQPQDHTQEAMRPQGVSYSTGLHHERASKI
jgi:hypothetical protein